MSSARKTAVPVDKAKDPGLSASLVIIDAKNEVLLVQRNPRSRAFGGVHVSA
jgi:hypothetical protein